MSRENTKVIQASIPIETYIQLQTVLLHDGNKSIQKFIEEAVAEKIGKK